MYALYSKNKPQSDTLLCSHGNEFFKVRLETLLTPLTQRVPGPGVNTRPIYEMLSQSQNLKTRSIFSNFSAQYSTCFRSFQPHFVAFLSSSSPMLLFKDLTEMFGLKASMLIL